MSLVIFNTLIKEKEEFTPIIPTKVYMYTCGPTVYNYAHIGNMRTYIFEDVLKRVILYNGYLVKHVMNITDVGHLTGDRDMGEDKIEKESVKENKKAKFITKFYTKSFKEDLKNLNILYPNRFCAVTSHIKDQIKMIKILEEKGYTYKIADGIYFDTSKVEDYTKLSHQNIEDLWEGARVEINEYKRNPTDFALWKFSPRDIKRQMEWNSPWGVGFPGWHIECSAISLKYLGSHFDIHCGAVDHINTHHTNEIAQTEAFTGVKPWVNYWVHGEFLNLGNDEKMAKSTGNFLTIKSEFINKNINPLAFRYATFLVHYRKKMEWTDDVLISAKNGFNNLINRVKNLGDKVGNTDKIFADQFLSAINDDLNMPKAMAIVQDLLKSDIKKEDKLATIIDFDRVLGFDILKLKKDKIPKSVKKLVEAREVARQNKDWKESDKLRYEINKLGYEVKDTDNGQEIFIE